MAINLIVADVFTFKVDGSLAGPAGDQPFDFTLTARRLEPELLRERLESDTTRMDDFLAEVVTGWGNVRDGSGPVAFSEENLRRLLGIPGIAALTLRAYVTNAGAKAKN